MAIISSYPDDTSVSGTEKALTYNDDNTVKLLKVDDVKEYVNKDPVITGVPKFGTAPGLLKTDENGEVTVGKATTDNVDFATYSTAEKVVGTWTDGKPIYRSVFSFTFPQTSQHIPHGKSVETPISVNINRGNQAIGSGAMHSATEGYFVKFTTTNLECRVIGTPDAFASFAVLEYTKP